MNATLKCSYYNLKLYCLKLFKIKNGLKIEIVMLFNILVDFVSKDGIANSCPNNALRLFMCVLPFSLVLLHIDNAYEPGKKVPLHTHTHTHEWNWLQLKTQKLTFKLNEWMYEWTNTHTANKLENESHKV